jgi:hypothetical protein
MHSDPAKPHGNSKGVDENPAYADRERDRAYQQPSLIRPHVTDRADEARPVVKLPEQYSKSARAPRAPASMCASEGVDHHTAARLYSVAHERVVLAMCVSSQLDAESLGQALVAARKTTERQPNASLAHKADRLRLRRA